MTATRMQYFYAKNWPIKIWFMAIPSLFLISAVYVFELSITLLDDWYNLLHFIFIILITLLIGIFFSILIGWFVLGPLYYNRCLKNGGPFHEGDIVQIIAGRYRDRILRVYSSWQGDSVRVMLGQNEKDKFQDIFSPTELIRVNDTEQPH